MGVSPRSESTEQRLGEMFGLLQGVSASVTELRESVRRQEDRSNIERGTLQTSIDRVRDEQNRTTVKVEMEMRGISARVQDLTDATKAISSIKDKVDDLVDKVDDFVEKVAKIESQVNPMYLFYSRMMVWFAVITAGSSILWALFSDSIKHFFNRGP